VASGADTAQCSGGDALTAETITSHGLSISAVTDESELQRIISEESDDSFESFTDLDDISDTTVLAITFLLSAQVSLSALVLDSRLLTGFRSRALFAGLGIVTMLLILLSLNSIIKALFPVGFYSDTVARPLLRHPLVPVGNAKPGQFGFLKPDDGSDDADERMGRVAAVGHNLRRKWAALTGRRDEVELEEYSARQVAERFVDDYSAFEDVDDFESYELAKHHHFKLVGSRKAKYTAIGLAWLRLSVTLFVVQFAVILGGVILS
jgi:hypothetical protein